jgi:hypothetical protein
MRGQEGNTKRGGETTSWHDEKPRRQSSKRTTRGNVITSWGDKTIKRDTTRACQEEMQQPAIAIRG